MSGRGGQGAYRGGRDVYGGSRGRGGGGRGSDRQEGYGGDRRQQRYEGYGDRSSQGAPGGGFRGAHGGGGRGRGRGVAAADDDVWIEQMQPQQPIVPRQGSYGVKYRQEGYGGDRRQQRYEGYGDRSSQGAPRGGFRGAHGDGGRGRGRGVAAADDDVWIEQMQPQQPIVPRQGSSRCAPSDALQLVEKIAGLKIDQTLSFPEKPAPGSRGTSISLFANYFLLKFKFTQQMNWYHYDITIERSTVGREVAGAEALPGPRRRSRKIAKTFNRIVIDEMVRINSQSGKLFHGIQFAYDSEKNLYTNAELRISEVEGKRLTVSAREYPEEQPVNFVVAIRKVAELYIEPNLESYPPEIIQVIDVILRYGPTKNKIPIGYKLFNSATKVRRIPLPENKELGFGFYQSARNCEGGLMLNVDRAAAIFHKGGHLMTALSNLIPKFEDRPKITPIYIKLISQEFKNAKIQLTHLPYPRKVRINEFSRQPASKLQFRYERRNEAGDVVSRELITVAEYFRQTYHRRLRYENLPCVVAGSRNAPKYFPLEVCILLPDQYVTRKLTEKVLSEMTTHSAAQKPPKRFMEIKEAVNDCIKADGEKINNAFGIEVDSDLVRLPGRVLNTPWLRYGNKTFKPNKESSWIMQKPDEKRFFNTSTLHSWILVNFASKVIPQEFLMKFARRLHNVANKLGLQISPPRRVTYDFKDTQTMRKELFQRALDTHPNLQLMICLIPKLSEVYYAIKKVGDVDCGLITQCILADNYHIDEEDPKLNKLIDVAYLTNLLAKINAKIGGTNTILEPNPDMPTILRKKRIMFVGVDVTHPAPGDKLSQSITAVVASYDNGCAKYITKLKVQERARQEIVELDTMMADILAKYREQNRGQSPEHIIIYRDGVSEGQFDHVICFEVTKLKNSFSDEPSKPKLTYIVVQKRHHTRFLPVDRKEASKSLNVPSGTTVDTVITHPSKFDFFICSHGGLLGTSRPTRYWILYDQNNFDSDSLQVMTYHLCFIFPRCTRSVSIPAPVYYAHLAAYRARHHIVEMMNDDASSISSEDSQQEERIQQLIEQYDRAVTVNERIQDRLYYI